MIYRLLGSPKGSLLEKYSKYPDWEKLAFTKEYNSNLIAEFSKHFDPMALSLLEKLLDLDPQMRLSAKNSLEHRYFSPDLLKQPAR
jgi:hypothetical protein